jgi:D-alanyl-D-alanine carboxypeptidase/D-alanyl-D-alanine-endopeptidase (penicillin-binding protein 4)
MTKHRDFAAYERAFPILGVDGTLASAISADSPLRGKVRAKTGTLTWDNVMNDRSLMTSKALAGYMTTAKGRKVVFALFVNGVHMKEGVTTRRAGSDLARLCEMVYESR